MRCAAFRWLMLPIVVGALGGCRSKSSESCVKEVVLGGSNSCFLVSAGYYLCRGDTERRAIGHGDWEAIPAEFRGLGAHEYVGLPKRFTRIELGSQLGCGVDGERRLFCWGRPPKGTIEGDEAERGIPVEQLGFGRIDDFSVNSSVCALAAGQVRCTGVGMRALEPIPGLPDGIRRVGAGTFFACAATDHEVYCWGQPAWANDQGSRHASENALVPWQSAVRIDGPSIDIESLEVGELGGCVLAKSGAVYCFGDNRFGGWGVGTVAECAAEAPCPPQDFRALHHVASLGNEVRQLALGGGACALKRDGSVWCWGWNLGNFVTSKRANSVEFRDGAGNMQVAENVEPLPVQREDLGRDNLRLYQGGGHACVEKRDHGIWCWGQNSRSEISWKCDGKQSCAPQKLEVPCPSR